MFCIKRALPAFCILVSAGFVLAADGLPDLDLSYATIPTAPQQISCPTCPWGDVGAMTGCYLAGAVDVSAVIDLYVHDMEGLPIILFPAEDLWVQADGLALCPGGSRADAPTDALGHTTLSGPFFAGGCSQDNSTNVFINGMPLNHPGLPAWFNSPDLNGDRVINIVDIALFAPYYFSGYSYCVDFHWDGDVNLSDLVILAWHLGHACP